MIERLVGIVTPAPTQKKGFADPARRKLLLWVVLLVTFLSIWHVFGEDARSQPRHGSHEDAAEQARPSGGGEASDVDSSP